MIKAKPVAMQGRKAASLDCLFYQDSRAANYDVFIICKFMVNIMKKIIFAFVLAFSCLVTQTSFAATLPVLAWDGAFPTAGGAAIGDINPAPSILTGVFFFTHTVTAPVSHEWHFTISSTADTQVGISLLAEFNVTAVNILLDDAAITPLGLGQYGVVSLLSAGSHTIKLVDLTATNGGNYTIGLSSPVPLPGAILLFGPALAVLAGVSRRKTSAA